MPRLRFENTEQFNILISESQKNIINKFINPDRTYNNRYINSIKINTKKQMYNFLEKL